jgi:hypothetical protein
MARIIEDLAAGTLGFCLEAQASLPGALKTAERAFAAVVVMLLLVLFAYCSSR